jgi:hypothetical protein
MAAAVEAGTVQVIEVITEPKAGCTSAAQDRAGRRMVGLPRFVVDALAERMTMSARGPRGPGGSGGMGAVQLR